MENLFVEVAKHSYVLYLPLLRSTGYKVWQQIPSEMQEVLKPHFNSRLVYICISLYTVVHSTIESFISKYSSN